MSTIEWFLKTRQRTLTEYQHLAGYLNWGLNILHWLRPALQPLYEKMRGKRLTEAKIYHNESVRKALAWFIARFEAHNGVSLMDSLAWTEADADAVLYTDASNVGLGFGLGIGHQRTSRVSTAVSPVQTNTLSTLLRQFSITKPTP
jgi:hypothetical protein